MDDVDSVDMYAVNFCGKFQHGFIARTIPKEYGGYGGTADILKSRIAAEEFAKEA